MRFVRNLVGYLVTGLIFWFPVAIVVFLLRYIFANLEDLGRVFIGWFLPREFAHTGIGTIISIVAVILTGLILKETSVGNALSKIPILGMFFRRSGETMTLEKLLGLTPCLFLFASTCPSYGWILSEQAVKLDSEIAHFSLINVYYPNVPTLITGQVYSVRKETVIRLGNQSREIIDVLLYGLRRPENIQYLAWEDESEEQFKQRAKSFGLT
jgi:uncharacterized membrane protein